MKQVPGSAVGEPQIVVCEYPRFGGAVAGRYLGGLLVVAAGLQLLGSLLRFETLRFVPPGAGFPSGRAISISSYDSLGGGRADSFFTVALFAALGCVAGLRPNRFRSGLIGAFCLPAVGATAYVALFSTERSRLVQLGPGYFVTLVGVTLTALVGAWMLMLAVLGPRDHDSRSYCPIGLGCVAAVVVGASALLTDLKVPGEPLGLFSPLALKSGVAALVAFAALAVVPLLAIWTRGRVGLAVVIGLAAAEAKRALEALGQRFAWPDRLTLQVTIGWWITVLGVAVLVSLAIWLIPHERPQPAISGGEI